MRYFRLRMAPPYGKADWGKYLPYLVLLSAIFIFWFAKMGAMKLVDRSPFYAEPLLYAAALTSLVAAMVGQTPAKGPFRILSGGVGLILAVVALQSFAGYPVINPDLAALEARYFLFGPAIAVIFGILSYWRPVLLVACASFSFLERVIIDDISGLPISSLDIAPVYEIGLFLGTAAFLMTGLRRIHGDADFGQICNLAWAASLGIHFGNYFYSGLAKLQLDGPWFAWIMNNHTNDIGMMNAWYDGRWLLSQFPELSAFIITHAGYTNVPGNIAVLLIQLVAPLALLRLNWTRTLTVLYDLMHIAIFLTVGLMFWKWILLNVVFLASSSKIKQADYKFPMQVTGVLCTVLAIYFAQTARLAWYNTPAVTSRFFMANTDDGKSYRVPIAYFLNQSYSVSHGRFFYDTAKHFPTSTAGETFSFSVHEAAKLCNFSDVEYAPQYHRERTEGDKYTRRFIREYHRYFLGLSDDGKFNYVLYPFHHFSNWTDYPEFMALDKRRIVSYTFVSRSHCLSIKNNKVHSDVRYESRIEIPVT